MEQGAEVGQRAAGGLGVGRRTVTCQALMVSSGVGGSENLTWRESKLACGGCIGIVCS